MGEWRLPIKLNPCSNGEFVPPPPSPVVREAVRRARQESDDLARRLGMSRRAFLRSSMGAATTLLALSACSEESGGGDTGRFTTTTEATTEPSVARSTVGGTEPIIDVQSHFLDYVGVPESRRGFGSGFPQASCGEGEELCFSIERWLQHVFLESDTTVAVLSAIPIVGDPGPLTTAKMMEARALADQLCGDGRVLLQGHAVPDLGDIEAAVAAMEEAAATYPLAAWKVYTHSPSGWSLDDRIDGGKRVGEAFLTAVERIGPRIVSVHKGLAGGNRFASPADIGPAAAAHPDVAFCVYHSGYESGSTEGAFDANDPDGVDRLVVSLRDAGVAPGSNVYAELGTTWRSLMGSPDEAGHVLGKLLLAVGEDNILWGTDSIWYGSPQDQIQAFRTFEITPEAQERHGYPALTPEVKAKILSGNAARLYRIDPAAAPCRFDRAELEGLRQESAFVDSTNGPVRADEVAAVFRAEHPWTVGL